MLSSATLSGSTCGASGPSTTKFSSYLLRFPVTNWKFLGDISASVNVCVCVCVCVCMRQEANSTKWTRLWL